MSVTQSLNTATSMGRLTLNVLLSFAQFEREVTAERIRDKIAASKKKGMWMGGRIPIGYEVKDRALIAWEDEASVVRQIYALYLETGTVRATKSAIDRLGYVSRRWITLSGQERGGLPFTRGHLYRIPTNPIYVGRIQHKGSVFYGQHEGIVDPDVWQHVQDQLQSGEVARSKMNEPDVGSDTTHGLSASVDGFARVECRGSERERSERRYQMPAAAKSQCNIEGDERLQSLHSHRQSV